MTIQHEMRRVLGYYDLGELRSAQQVERGYVNQNWIIQTTRGQYFLKHRHPELRNRDIIRAQHALTDHLRKSGFPAPAILSTPSGEKLLVIDGEFYEIQECIQGAPYEHGRSAHFQAAAIMLGRYHDCIQGFAPLALCHMGDLYNPASLTANLRRLTEAWTRDRDPALEDFVRRLESQAADLRSRFASHDQLPHLMIHGDYHAGNLLFHGDRIVGVVDYDKARWQPRVVELAEAIIYFASPRPGHLRHLVYPGFLQWDKFTNFLHYYTYTKDVSLKGQEIRALPDYIRCIWLSVSLQQLLEKGHRPTEALQPLQEVLSLGDWAASNRQRMIGACYSVLETPGSEISDLNE
jgi:homoserine kinase type II